MKSGDRFSKHIQRASFMTECFNVEYERLKAVLRTCHHCKRSELDDCCEPGEPPTSIMSSFGPCSVCDEIFLKEVAQQISAVAGCFASSAQRLLQPHNVSRFQRYLWNPRLFVVDSRQQMIENAQNLMIYIARNAIATGKLLKKYEKVRCRKSNNNLGSKLQAKQIELLKSPWIIELCAFQINATGSEGGDLSEINGGCSCSFDIADLNGPSIRCTVLKSVNLDFNLTCPICLDTAFDPVALGCGHIFCNTCACNSVSVPTIAGVNAANQRAKCPLCRQMGVYANSVHLIQLGLLLKKRCKEFWKERLLLERKERVKQAKEHWDQQARLFLGF